MKKCSVLLISLVIMLLVSACEPTPEQTVTTTTTADATTTTAVATTETTTSTTTATTVVSAATPTVAPTATPTATPAPTATPTATPTPTAAPTTAPTTSETTVGPVNTASFYTSYAFMVSYDPARGWADFDYFNMLRGDAAVQWLVDREGYTLAEAQEIVDNYGDSEHIMQNDNPQLRTIDLNTIELRLMYYPDGSEALDAVPIESELIDLYDLYHVDSNLVLNSYFYYIEVADSIPVAVTQVFWP
jgi:hypothetical protein